MSRKTKLEKIRDIIELPYVRLPLAVTVLLLIGLALIYLIALMASVYALAVLFGIATVQLVIGIFSATGTLASATVAYLLYRNSIRGAQITVALEDPLEADMEYRVRKTLSNEIPSAQQELGERLHFTFPLIWLNGGPSGGAITNVELRLVKPPIHYPTMRNGEGSEDEVSVAWTIEISEPEERVNLNSVKLPVFSGGLKNSMSIGSNESKAMIADVTLHLSDIRGDERPPANSWSDIRKGNPYFVFKLRWKTASKDRLRSNERSFSVKAKFGEPILEGPARVLS